VEEQKNVRWILIVSVLMFFVSAWLSPSLFLFGGYGTRYDGIWYIISRLDALFFVATITTATLFTVSFGKKEITYKLSVYFFLISMAIFFLIIVRSFFTSPYA